jgi:preprotein translocase subunit SecY
MAGIIAQMPTFFANLFEGGRSGSISPFVVVGLGILLVGMVLGICFMELAQRRLLIQYPKRATQNGMMQADRSHLPLKINTSGVIPPIFASSLLLLPLTITQFAGQSINPDSTAGSVINTLNFYLRHGEPLYMALYAIGIIFFTFFYTAVVFNPEETAENLKKNGGFIPGIRPGKRTQDYLDYVLTRITVVGAIYLTVVSLIPEMLHAELNISQYIGGTSLIILVTVTLDTISQIQSHLIAQQYEGLVKRARLGGRRR